MKEKDEPKYKVMRDCCTSGNCVTCLDLPYGTKKRVSQMGDTPLSKEMAERVKKGWASYRPTIEVF